MVPYERILVPTDGSAGVERAIQHAVDLAVEHGAEVHAVYVINSGAYVGTPMEIAGQGVDTMLREEATDAVEGVAAVCDDYEVPVETTVLKGSPNREIIRYAESEDCDLIVMGTHGRGGIDRLLLGSVAEKVVRGSKVPVLTVRVGD